MSSARSAMRATPPTTPPAMAPTGVDEPESEGTEECDGINEAETEAGPAFDVEDARAVEDADNDADVVASTPTLTVLNI